MENNGKRFKPQNYAVSCLEDFYTTILKIESIVSNSPSEEIMPLWYRGHEQSLHSLLPSAFRHDDFKMNDSCTYSNNMLREEYRYQSFRARASHKTEYFPESRFEWFEIMQHHFAKTRLMDWSESATSALIFALEAMIDPKDGDAELDKRRKTFTPTVWVLNPKKVNSKIYDIITKQDSKGGYPFIKQAVTDLVDDKEAENFSQHIGKELSKKTAKEVYCDCGEKYPFINGLVSLSVINSYRQELRDRLYEMICRFEFNPFFYLLARFYVDGLAIPAGALPPISSIHPYHSQRIIAQKGAFSVFPHYYYDSRLLEIKNMGVDIGAMENQSNIQDTLFQIRITNPSNVVKELIISGEKYTSVYPELERYAKELEAEKYHI